MKKLNFILSVGAGLIMFSCGMNEKNTYSVKSPDGRIEILFSMNEENQTTYQAFFNGAEVLAPSRLGVKMEDTDLSAELNLESAGKPERVRDNYRLLHGKKKDYSYEANRQVFHLSNHAGVKMDIVFQVSNDGAAFRYFFPGEQGAIKKINEETTSFYFPDGTRAWMQPKSNAKSGWARSNPSYEEHYLQEIPVGTPSPVEAGWVFPALFRNGDNWILVSETGIDRNYCGSSLRQESPGGEYFIGFPQPEEVSHSGELNPQSELPWYSPWRVIAMGSLKTIVESTLGTDLAIPAMEGDFSWVRPGRASWSWVLLKDGMTTYPVQKQFIDYAVEMGWEYCLIDALWDTQIGYEKIGELAAYAKEKGVGVWLWYNSSGDWNETPQTPKSMLLTHEDRRKEFGRIKDMGVAGVKVDFFGGDGQSVIAYYHDILKDAAETGLMVNFHGCTLPRGWQRTYPNMLSMEAIKGMEFVTFEQANADLQPNHCTVIPFTRNVFDPMDFTPTAFSEIDNIQRKTSNAFELALPVLFMTGAQHYAETPEGMKAVPEYVRTMMREIPVVWDETRFVDGYPGKYVVIARRSGDTWYIAGINGEDSVRNVHLELPFINKSQGFIITDGDTDRSFERNNLNLDENNNLDIAMKPRGGFLIRL